MKQTFSSLIILVCLSALLPSSRSWGQQVELSFLEESLQFRSIGPFRGGRSAAVAGVVGDPMTFYMGATGGGVWKTSNGGTTWNNISDGYFGGSIGAVAVSLSNPNVLYVGGGEVTVRGNVSPGTGMYKSVDGGRSWKDMGLKQSRHIPRIRIHPSNPDVVYAAVLGDLFKDSEERGVYKSVDGGKSWERMLHPNARSGAVDIVLDPGNPEVLYASTWNVRRTPYDFSSGGDGSALWKSTDGGATWTSLMDNEGLPEGPHGIIGVTVSPVNPNRVWAIIENEKAAYTAQTMLARRGKYSIQTAACANALGTTRASTRTPRTPTASTS